MIKVLFVNSKNPYSEVENRYHPLWPAYLAAYAEEKLGSGVVDFQFCRNNFEVHLDQYKPDIVAIGAVTQNYGYAVTYSKIAKERSIPVIIGGIHITSLPETLTEDMDVGCIGEGEETFCELLQHFIRFEKFDIEYLDNIDGIVFHKKGKLIKTPDRQPIQSLDEMPPPKRSMIGYQYRGYVYTARGCAYNCVFCICSRYWGKIRYVKPERVIEELKEYADNGTRVVRFADENFTGNVVRLKEIASLILSSGLNKRLKFSCWCRANTVTPEVVDILKSINVVSVKMGLESGSQRVLDYLKGGVKVEDNERAIRLFRKARIQVNGDFIIGAPDETLNEIRLTYDFIRKMPLNFVDINLFSAYPGTPIWEYALQKKLVSNDMDWELINIKLDQTGASSIILSEKLSYSQLYNEYKRFRKLRLYKSLMSLFNSPWLNEIPGIILKLLIGKAASFFKKNK